MVVTELRHRLVARLALAAVLLGLVLLAVPSGRADAALGGLTLFAIDGDTAGPDDWDALPTNLLEHQSITDPCGNGVLDPDQLDGKLVDLDLLAPAPSPGNVVGKGDLCRVWRAVEAVPNPGGGYDIVLYGAWERFASNGEVTAYWPLVGPAPGRGDDFLVEFEATASGGGAVRGLRWGGSDWVPLPSAPAGTTDVAFDYPDAPLFGEFAVNLSALGLWPSDGDCSAYTSDFVFSRTGNSANAELQDYVGFAPVPLTQCATLVVRKVTTPAAPDPAQTFGYSVAREGGDEVVVGSAQVTGALTVPGAAEDTVPGVVAADDYLLTEAVLPPGWTLQSVTCDVLDPTTGIRSRLDVTAGGTFPVAPGGTTVCVISNVGPATLTIAKATVPEGSDDTFSFTGTRPGGDPVDPFTLTAGTSHEVPVAPGDTVTVTEASTVGWTLEALDCTGDDEAVTDPAAGTAVVDIDAGEQVVCTFVNAVTARAPGQAYLLVEKVVEVPDGTEFNFAVTGPATASTFTLTPPDTVRDIVVVTPEPSGSLYAVSEAVPDGWELADAACRSTSGAVGVTGPAGVSDLVMLPDQVTYCRFTDAPVAPPARLTVVKTTVPAGGTGFDFATRGLDPVGFSLDDGVSQVFEGLVPGSYRVTEDVTADWLATGSCDDGTPVRGGRVDVVLAAGDDVTCTFVNSRRVSLSVTKRAEPTSTQDFPFAVALERSAPVRFDLDDDGSETDDPEAAQLTSRVLGAHLVPGVYTITESGVDDWRLDSLVCSGGEVLEQDASTGTAIVRLAPGDSAECDYLNVLTLAPPPPPEPTPDATDPAVVPTSGAPTASTAEALGVTGPGGVRLTLVAGVLLLLAGCGLAIVARRRRT